MKTYSLGMKQRLGIGAALLKDPALLILDEPANGLDPAGIVEVRELLRRLGAEGRTVFVSSHILSEIQQTADRVAILARGRCVREGAVAEVLASQRRRRPDRPAPRSRGGQDRARRRGDRVDVAGDALRVNVAATEAERVSRTLAERGLYVTELRPEEVDLETVFLELTRDQGIDPEPRVVTDLIRSELLRIWSRRMVRVLAILAVIGSVVGVTIGAIQSSKPDLVAARTALRRRPSSLPRRGHHLRKTSFHPAMTLEQFCADNIRLESYVNSSLQLSELSAIPESYGVHPDRAGAGRRRVVRRAPTGRSGRWPRSSRGSRAVSASSWSGSRSSSVPSSCWRSPCSPCSRWSSRPPRRSAARPWAPRARGSQASCGPCFRIAGASALGAWLGVTLAMVGRNTAAALGVAFGYLAIVETLLRGFIPKISDSLLSTNLVVFVDGRAGTSESGSPISVGGSVVTLSLYAGVLVIVALALFRTRDVT